MAMLKPTQSYRVVLLALALSACSGGGGPQTFSYYCDDLNTMPSTWNLAATGTCPLDGGFPLRPDLRTPQACGASCACAVTAWTYGSTEQDLEFTTIRNEWCQSQMSCTLPSGTAATGTIYIAKPQGAEPILARAQLVGAGAGPCELDLSGGPQ